MKDLTLFIDELSRLAVQRLSRAEFLPQAIELLRTSTKARHVSLLRPLEGEWQSLASSGETGKLPIVLAADALDQSKSLFSAEWCAIPFADARTSQDGPNDWALLVRASTSTNTDLLAPAAQTTGVVARLVAERASAQLDCDRSRRMLSFAQKWYQTNETEPLLVEIAEAATELLTADRASIFLWDKPNQLLVGRPALGLEDNELRLSDSEGIVGEVVQSGEPRRVDGPTGTDQINRSIDEATGYTTTTVLCVPLITSEGACLGAFEVLNKKTGRFTDEDERQLAQLAQHAALALEQTQQWEQLLSRHQQLVEQAASEIQLIGQCAAIEALRSSISRIADTDLAILILGQNGTGKEVVARQIHFSSRRRDNPFVAVNCAALTETLLESELFGHEKGAFTDAHETRQGKFELASGGTLFLDEIGDMSQAGQAKLLRVLEDKKVVRVGGATQIHTEVRIIAATNQNLDELVRQGKFRQDLYFRLNVVMLELPPLNERGEDILLLAQHFLQLYCRNIGRKTPKFSSGARKRLLSHNWPGNVRELKNMMERLAYLSDDAKIDEDELSFATASRESRGFATIDGTLTDATRSFQIRYVQRAMDRTRGNMSEAARLLGLHRSNLYRKMRQLGMTADDADVED